MRQLTNNIGSIVFQNLKRLWDILFHSKNDYQIIIFQILCRILI